MTHLSDRPRVEWVVKDSEESIVCGHSTREAATECASVRRTHRQATFTVEKYIRTGEGGQHE